MGKTSDTMWLCILYVETALVWYEWFCVVEEGERFGIVHTGRGDGWFAYASQHSPLLCMLSAKDVCQLGSKAPPPSQLFPPHQETSNYFKTQKVFLNLVTAIKSLETNVGVWGKETICATKKDICYIWAAKSDIHNIWCVSAVLRSSKAHIWQGLSGSERLIDANQSISKAQPCK